MKNKLKILLAFIGLVMLFTACSPGESQLGSLLDKSALKFSVTPDTKDPNMIILSSLTPGVTPQWITPLGRSIRVQDTVKIAFPGTYKFVYGVESAGGLVQADTITLNITTSNLSYVNDPLWTLICGGVGQEKTWILDINAAGVSKYFAGPKYFEGSEETWNSHLLRAAGTLDADIATQLGATPANIWEWAAGWSGNTWIMPAADYGTMTFDLKNNGAHITVNHLTIPTLGTQNGTFLLDATKHTLTLNNAVIIHNSGSEADAKGGYGRANVLTLTDNYMQLNIPGSGSYNFISKAYSDSWIPKVVNYAEPIKSSFTQANLIGTWKYNLVGENWISWEVEGSGTGGSQENNWFTRADMIATLTGWGGSASTFTNADSNVYVFNADGTCNLNGITNTYSVANGVITFGKALAGTEWSLVYIALTGTTVNVLNVTTIGTTPYTSSGIWLGIRNGTKNEDQAVQLVKQY